MQYLCIDTYYDESHTLDIESYIPSMYKTLGEYEADKFNAKLLIMSNKAIPKEMFNRLLDARKELEQKGILETIT